METLDKYDSLPSLGDQATTRSFTAWVVVSQLFSLAAVILVAVWMGNFRGGFAWQEDPAKEFNYHPLFMVIGMVFLYGEAILVYRVFRNEKKMTIKLLHAALHVFALVFAGVGLKAVFDSHNLPEKKTPNMYSLHSWLGIITVGLFGLQWLCGLFAFLLPGLPMRLRGIYKPTHMFWGIGVFCLAIASALTGITEKAFFSNSDYSGKNPEGILINCLGLVLVGVGLSVGYIVSNPNYARQPAPEEEEERIQLTH